MRASAAAGDLLFDAVAAGDKAAVEQALANGSDVDSRAPDAGLEEVPDPYYGGATGFEQVLDLVEEASLGLLRELRKQLRAA